MSLTRRCNANHNNPDRTQRAERSWKRPAQQTQKLQKCKCTLCLIDCASHDSFPLPTTYAIESTFLMDSYGKYMRMGVLYPLGFLESPETRPNNAPCCLLLFTYTYPTCVGIHISYMERLSIAFPSKWAVLIPTCPTEKRLVWRKGFV